MLWPAAKITLCAGKAAFWSSASEVFTPVIREESRPTTPPNSRRAFLIIRVAAHEMGSTHWSTRKLGKTLGISHNRVHRTWRRIGLQPHRVRRYMASDDPQFEKKAADIIGPVSYTHLRAHETPEHLVCRLLLEK